MMPLSIFLAVASLTATPGAARGNEDRCCDDAGPGCCDRILEVELLAIDLESCTRCTGSRSTAAAAVEELRPLLGRLGVDIQFSSRLVRSADEAVALRLRSSPTLRVNGRDVDVELRENSCGECTSLCGKAEVSIDCRAWVWQGKLFEEPPTELVIDAILRAYGTAFERQPAASEPFDLPENLRRFFDRKTARASSGEGGSQSNPAGPRAGCCGGSGCCGD